MCHRSNRMRTRRQFGGRYSIILYNKHEHWNSEWSTDQLWQPYVRLGRTWDRFRLLFIVQSSSSSALSSMKSCARSSRWRAIRSTSENTCFSAVSLKNRMQSIRSMSDSDTMRIIINTSTSNTVRVYIYIYLFIYLYTIQSMSVAK